MDGFTDEFCRLVKGGDATAKLDAVVQGDMDGYGYRYGEENVNADANVGLTANDIGKSNERSSGSRPQKRSQSAATKSRKRKSKG
jgi:hypothetical protein